MGCVINSHVFLVRPEPLLWRSLVLTETRSIRFYARDRVTHAEYPLHAVIENNESASKTGFFVSSLLIWFCLLFCSFYELDDTNHEAINKYLSHLVEKALFDLESSYCIEVGEVSSSRGHLKQKPQYFLSLPPSYPGENRWK